MFNTTMIVIGFSVIGFLILHFTCRTLHLAVKLLIIAAIVALAIYKLGVGSQILDYIRTLSAGMF